MTREEQKRIIRSLEGYGEAQAVAFSLRLARWAKDTFGIEGTEPELGSRGIRVQYRVAYCDEWQLVRDIRFTSLSWETRDDTQWRKEAVQNLFYWTNMESSNTMGDVVEVRCVPYICVNDVYRLKEDECKRFACTDTGERRRWNQLNVRIYAEPGGSIRGYDLIHPDIHQGENICWYEAWHFSLEDDAPCPVAPIIVEEITPYALVLRYREQLYTLNMSVGQPHEVKLEHDVPVTPTHNWSGMWLRPPYTFRLVLTIAWKETLYDSSDRDNFHQKPHYVRTSDLPADVRTMQQQDHDAWSSQN